MDLTWMHEWHDWKGHHTFGPWSLRVGNRWLAVQANGRAIVAVPCPMRVFPQPPGDYRAIVLRYLRAKPAAQACTLARFRKWIGEYTPESRYVDSGVRPVRIGDAYFNANAVADALRFVKARKVEIAVNDHSLYIDAPDWRVVVRGLDEDAPCKTVDPATLPVWPVTPERKP